MGRKKKQQKLSNDKLNQNAPPEESKEKKSDTTSCKKRTKAIMIANDASPVPTLPETTSPKKLKIASTCSDLDSDIVSTVTLSSQEQQLRSGSMLTIIIPSNAAEFDEPLASTVSEVLPERELLPSTSKQALQSVTRADSNHDKLTSILTSVEIAHEIDLILANSRNRVNSSGEPYRFDWHVIIQCLVSMMSEHKFEVEHWHNLFKEKTCNSGKGANKIPSIFLMMCRYVQLNNEKAKVTSLSSQHKVNENSYIREKYARPVFNKIKGPLKEIMCTFLVKLFDCLYNPAIDGAKCREERLKKLGKEVTDGYNRFKSNHSDYSSSIWKQRIALPKEQRKRFVYANHLEDPNYQIIDNESDVEGDGAPTAIQKTKDTEESVVLAHEMDEQEANEKLAICIEQHKLADDELKRLEELRNAAEKNCHFWKSEVAKQEDRMKKAYTNAKIVEVLSAEKNDDKRYWMAKVGVKMTQNCPLNVLQRLAAQNEINFDMRNFLTPTAAYSEAEAENFAEFATFDPPENVSVLELDAAQLPDLQSDYQVDTVTDTPLVNMEFVKEQKSVYASSIDISPEYAYGNDPMISGQINEPSELDQQTHSHDLTSGWVNTQRDQEDLATGETELNLFTEGENLERTHFYQDSFSTFDFSILNDDDQSNDFFSSR